MVIRRALPFLFCLVAILFTGCFEFAEDIWINADGTGRLQFDVSFSQAFMDMGRAFGQNDSLNDMSKKFDDAGKKYKSDSRVSRVIVHDTTYDEMHHFQFTIDAKSYTDLPELHSIFFADTGMAPEGDSKERPELHVTTAGSNVHVVIVIPRDSAVKNADTSVSADSFGEAIAGAMFGNKGFIFHLHAPRISASNGKIDTVAHTVEWKIPLTSLKHMAGHEFTADVVMPAPIARITAPSVWVWVILAALVLVLFGVFLFRKRSRTPSI